MRVQLALVVILAAAACTADSPPPEPTDPVRVVTLAEDLRIDGHAADLVPITWLTVSPVSGTIALILWQDHQVRFFAPDGSPLVTVGREGEGPGEFMRPIRGGWVGDTLWVGDTQLGRVSLVSPTAGFVRTVTQPPSLRPATEGGRTFGSMMAMSVYPGDTLLATVRGVVGGPDLAEDVGNVLARVSPDGVVQREVAHLPSQDGGLVEAAVEGGFVYASVPFHPDLDWTVAPDGSRVAWLTSDPTGPDSSVFRVRVMDERGMSLLDREFRVPAEPIPGAVMDSALDRAVSRHEPGLRADMKARLRDVVPSFYPPAEEVVLGTDGRVWVGLRETAEGRDWLILDRDGEPWGRTALPAGATLHAADATHLYVTTEDELGVESVVRYRIVADGG